MSDMAEYRMEMQARNKWEEEKCDRLREVLRHYLEASNWAEPLDLRGVCGFCGAIRSQGQEPHATDCHWWTVVQPMMDEEVARR